MLTRPRFHSVLSCIHARVKLVVGSRNLVLIDHIRIFSLSLELDPIEICLVDVSSSSGVRRSKVNRNGLFQ